MFLFFPKAVSQYLLTVGTDIVFCKSCCGLLSCFFVLFLQFHADHPAIPVLNFPCPFHVDFSLSINLSSLPQVVDKPPQDSKGPMNDRIENHTELDSWQYSGWCAVFIIGRFSERIKVIPVFRNDLPFLLKSVFKPFSQRDQAKLSVRRKIFLFPSVFFQTDEKFLQDLFFMLCKKLLSDQLWKFCKKDGVRRRDNGEPYDWPIISDEEGNTVWTVMTAECA